MSKINISVAVHKHFKLHYALLPNQFFVSMYETLNDKFIKIEDRNGKEILHSFNTSTFDGNFLQKVYDWLQHYSMNNPNSLIVDADKLIQELTEAGVKYKNQENWPMLEEVMWLQKYVETHQNNGKVTVTQMQLIEAGVL